MSFNANIAVASGCAREGRGGTTSTESLSLAAAPIFKERTFMSRSAFHRLKPALLACVVATSFSPAAALAQQVDSNKLLEIMVRKGLVTREEADAMIAEASTNAPAQVAARAPIPAGGRSADGVLTVPYVPQVVRDQIKEELRTELGQQAAAQGWARPGETPEWTRRISLYGDVRVRGEGRFFSDPVLDSNRTLIGGNYDQFPDWGLINGGNPWNSNRNSAGAVNPPYINSTEDRRRFRLRARLGLKAQVTDWISADIRLATGADHGAVSTNQTLGADGTGKYQIWLDRASLRLTPVSGVAIDFGRFANPFWTSDLVYDNDMNFDGVAISGSGELTSGLRAFGTAGAFPVFNTSMNFGSRDVGAFASTDKYLYGVQAGLEFSPVERLSLKGAVAYFHYDGAEGRFSSQCGFLQESCDTDETRPAFQQYGNTMRALRNFKEDPSLPPGTTATPQYFGLASKFRILTYRGQAEYRFGQTTGVRLEGEYAVNLDYDRSDLAAIAVNNFAPDIRYSNGTEVKGGYRGSGYGWQGRLTFGVLDLGLGFGQPNWSAKAGDWSAHIGYRRLGSDAVIDGFADSDFGLGGTNVKGWFAGANYGIAKNSFIGLRWMSADEIAGQPLSVDRAFIDLSTKF